MPGDGSRTYCFDIDGTLCSNTWGAYEKAEPFGHMIAQVNALHEAGHRIILLTARGSTTGIDWRPQTEIQLRRWGVRYHELHLGKPQADLYIDDRAMSLDEWAAKSKDHISGTAAAAHGKPGIPGPLHDQGIEESQDR